MRLLKKHKHLIFISIITLIGALYRFWHLDKPDGFWFDEMVTYTDASERFSEIIIRFFKQHMHAPLFYILLHFWMSIFGNADTTLRILPVIIGILNIPVIYLCGKELKCDKTALLAAFFVAINSLLIYYSQEMRLYSLTALFSSLIILFCLRLHNNPSKLNIIGLTLANIGLLYTHTISFVFVFFEFIVFAVFFWSKNRNSFKLLIISGFATLILYTPLIYKIFNVMKAGINSGITAQWWSTFTFDQILLVLGDSYSPFIVTHKIAPLSYFDFLGDTIHLIVFWAIFGIIPALIGLMGIILSLFNKNPLPKLLLLVCFGFLGVFTIAAIQGKVVYVCRYIIEITPLLLLLTAYGCRRC